MSHVINGNFTPEQHLELHDLYLGGKIPDIVVKLKRWNKPKWEYSNETPSHSVKILIVNKECKE